MPQSCPPTAENPTRHTCNLYEIVHDLTPFNQAALAINALALVMMLLTELSVFRRERWLDNTLSYNPRKAAKHLSEPGPDGKSPLEEHPYIAHQLLWQNITAGNLARATIGVLAINLAVSSALILGFYYDGTRSVTALITNTLLLGSKLMWAAIVCLASKNNMQGVSLYKMTRVNFNVIDANFLTSEEFARNKNKYSWEHVKEEHARIAQAEKGDLRLMATHASAVLRHVAIGRHTTSASVRKFREANRLAALQEAEAAAAAAPSGQAARS